MKRKVSAGGGYIPLRFQIKHRKSLGIIIRIDYELYKYATELFEERLK